MASAVTITPDASPAAAAPVTITPDATQAPPRSWTDSLGDFASHLWNQINPVGGAKGVAQLLDHPVDTLESDYSARQQVYGEAEKSFQNGHPAAGAAKMMYAFAPFLGPQLNQAANDFAEGKIAAALGTSVGMGLSIAGPDAIGDVSLHAPGLQEASEALYRKALKPSLRNSTGEIGDMVRTGLQDQIPVSAAGSAKISGLIDDLNEKIKAQIASRPSATVNAADVASRLDNTAAKFGSQVNPTADLNAIQSARDEFLATNPPDISAASAQELKQGTYKQMSDRAYGELSTATNESQKALARGLKEELQNQFPEIGGLNAHDSQLIGLDDAIESRVKAVANRALIPGGVWSGAALGAASGAWSGGMHSLEGAGIGAAAGALKTVLMDPMVQSKLAIAINKGSKLGVALPTAASRIAIYSNLLGNDIQAQRPAQ